MDAFEGLADPVRRALLRRLVQGPARAGDLAADHDISRPAVSRHLRVLHEAGLVAAESRGRERVFRLRPAGAAPVQELLDAISSSVALGELGMTEERLMALDTEVRRGLRASRNGAGQESGQGSGHDSNEEESAFHRPRTTTRR